MSGLGLAIQFTLVRHIVANSESHLHTFAKFLICQVKHIYLVNVHIESKISRTKLERSYRTISVASFGDCTTPMHRLVSLEECTGQISGMASLCL